VHFPSTELRDPRRDHTVVSGFFNTLTNWVLNSVGWFLSSAACADLGDRADHVIRSAAPEFNVLMSLSPALLMVGLLVATLQALRHGDAASLWRVYLGVAPACVLALFVARPFATLILQTVNQLSSSAANTVIERQAELTSALTSVATAARLRPLRAGRRGRDRSWLLWCELIVRAVILTLLLVLVPVIVPLATFPADVDWVGAWPRHSRRRREQVPHRDYSDLALANFSAIRRRK